MKLTKRISLLMAIIMVVTTIMSVMPVTVIAAAPAATKGVSVIDTATGQVYELGGTKVDGGTWADALALANKATSPVTIVLHEDVSTTARPDFDNTSAVIVEGNGHMLSISVSGGANNCLIGNKGNNTVVKFQNLTIKLLANGGTGIKVLGKANATFENVFVTGRTKWAVFNLETVGGNMTLNLKNSIINATVEGSAGDSTRSAIFTGNGADTGAGKTVTVDINNSVICGPGGVNLSKGTTGTVTVTNSTFVISDTAGSKIGVRLSGVEKDDSSKSSCTITGSTIYAMGKDVAITPVSNGGAGTVSGSFNTSIPVTVLANGISNGKTYTSWGNAVADANAALANGNAEIRLNGNVYFDVPGTSGGYANAANGSASNGGYLGAAGSNKLTIAGATGNEKFIIQRAHHALYSTGIVEFKNLTIESNATSLVANNKVNRGDGEQLIFNNVDIYVNAKTHNNHVIPYMEFALGSENNPYKLDFINGTTVQFKEGFAGTIGSGFVWCDYRGGHYVDITVDNSTIDLTDGTASAFYLQWCTGKENDGADCSADKGMGLINMTVTNSEIVTKGANAIQGADQIKSFKMDLDSSIAGLSIGTDCGAMNNGAKVQLIGSETPSITVNGTNYTSFKAAMAAAMTATDDVTITLNSNVVVGEQIDIKQANGKKITVDGQGKYTILTIGVNNVMCPAEGSTGAVEFKNLSVYSNSTGSFCQIFAPVDVTFENVDILVSRNQRYCLVNSLYDNCITPAKVIFRNVNVTGDGLTGQHNAGVNVYRSGNEGFDNFINLIVDNCNFDLSGENVGGIMILKGTTANVFIKDSYIYGSSTDSINSKPVYVSGSVNSVLGDQMLPEGFKANTTTCTFVNSEFDGENYIAENLTSKAYTASQVAPATQNGAEVRLKDPTGLRFITDISNTVIANVESFADEDSVKFGTLIVPAKFLSGYAFDEYIEEFLAEGNAALILDIPATEVGTEVTANGVTLRAAVVGLEGMYKEQLTAMAYIEFTVQGETFRIYGNSTDKRSVEGVATDALADKSATADDEYKYLVNEGEYGVVGQYSPYTKEQRDILAKYAGLK